MALRKTSLVLLRNFLSSPSDHLLSARLTAATCRLSYPCPRGFSHDTAREESSALDATGQSTYKGPLARTLTNLKVTYYFGTHIPVSEPGLLALELMHLHLLLRNSS